MESRQVMQNMEAKRSLFLSHVIHGDTPMYADEGAFSRTMLKSIHDGDTANSERWSMNNHTGTHIDCPRHFYKGAKSLTDFAAEFFIVDRAFHVDLADLCSPGLVFTPSHFETRSIPPDIQALLLKTGFESYRGDRVYWEEGPGYAEELADYFRRRFKQLRFFGFDSISLTSLQNRPLGKRAHLAFLGGDAPILPIEDMHLADLASASRIRRLTVAPLQVDQADGSPVTVIAELADAS